MKKIILIVTAVLVSVLIASAIYFAPKLLQSSNLLSNNLTKANSKILASDGTLLYEFNGQTTKKYPHFVDYVIQEIAYKKLTAKGDSIYNIQGFNEKEVIDNTNSKQEDIEKLQDLGNQIYIKTIDELKAGGYTIQTTINPNTQTILEQNLAKTPLDNFAGNTYAGVILDGSTGNIVAMQGSKDYNNSDISGQVNQIAQLNPYDNYNGNAYHTVGSTFKVFNYIGALSKGVNPQTMLKNECIKFGPRLTKLENYTKGFCSGQYTLAESISKSYNIGATKALYIGGNGFNPDYLSADQDKNGKLAIREVSEKMGAKFQTSKNKQSTRDQHGSILSYGFDSIYGSSVAIGADDVSFLSHVTAFNTLAQSGDLKTATPFISIKYNKGDNKEVEVYQDKKALAYPNTKNVIDQGIANQTLTLIKNKTKDSLITWDVENQDIATVSGTATRSFAGLEQTSDLTIASVSKKYTTFVWAGNVTNQGNFAGIANLDSTRNLGENVSKPLMQELHKGLPESRFTNEGLRDFEGQMLTENQIQKNSEAKKVF
jgi:membrane peptidoglycan carboxypeptidase